MRGKRCQDDNLEYNMREIKSSEAFFIDDSHPDEQLSCLVVPTRPRSSYPARR